MAFLIDADSRSRRAEKRGQNDNATVGQSGRGGQQGHGGGYNNYQQQQRLNREPVAPLQASANRWDRKAIQIDADSPEMVDRKVKGLLNKLTMEKFDSISDQIISWANKSEKEKDGRTLIQVIRLVFEKATDEATWSEMYARLCRKMMEQISPKVQDDEIKNNKGKPIAGGQLFRKYLLNRCQEDFERGWLAKETTPTLDVSQAAGDRTRGDGKDEKIGMYSEEYHTAQKARRQGLGLIKFIGELFKLQMLTERIMHKCVKKLLGNDNPEKEDIESLCVLLGTVGEILDKPKARAHCDVYFARIKELTKGPNVTPRMQQMLQDLAELRERRWVTRNPIAVLETIVQAMDITPGAAFSAGALAKPKIDIKKMFRNPTTAPSSNSPSYPPSPLGKLKIDNKSMLQNLPPPSPPPPPSSASIPNHLNAASNAFVPQTRVTLKKEDGTEITLENLKSTPAPAPTTTTSTPQGSAYRQGSPGTPTRRPASIRIESEDQRKLRLAEEEQKEKEKARVKAEAEEKVRKEKEEVERKTKEAEKKRKAKEAEKKKRKEGMAEEEWTRKEAEEWEAQRTREEEERKRKDAEFVEAKARVEAEAEEKVRKEKEEVERKAKEAEEKKKKAKEAKKKRKEDMAEKERIRKEEERTRKEAEETVRKEKEEVERKAKEAEEKKKAKEAKKKRKEDMAEKERIRKEEEWIRKEAENREAQCIREEEERKRRDAEFVEVKRIAISSKDDGKYKPNESLRMNAGATSPTINRTQGPGLFDLTDAKSSNILAPQPALATARIISDISSVQYPEGISGPRPDLYGGAKEGEFRYDRDFLLQFMSICKEKPPTLPPLDALGLEPFDQPQHQMTRPQFGHRSGPGGAPASPQSSFGLGLAPGIFNKGPTESFSMVNFATAGMQYRARAQLVNQTTGQCGSDGPLERGENNKASGDKNGNGYNNYQQQQLSLELVTPLQATANFWDRKVTQINSDSIPMLGTEYSEVAVQKAEAEVEVEMTEAEATKKIKEDLKEFFAVRNLEEAEVYFKIPARYHHVLVDKLVSNAVESKEADAKLVSDFFDVAVSQELCSAQAFEEGFTPIAEIIDDIVIDAPKAFQLFALMVKGAKLDEDRRNRLASKSFDSDKLLALFRDKLMLQSVDVVSARTTNAPIHGASTNVYQVPPDAWTVAHDGWGSPRPPFKGGDLSRSRNMDKRQPTTSGQSSVSASTSKKAAQTTLEESNVVVKSAHYKYGMFQTRTEPVESDSLDAAATLPVVDTESGLHEGTADDLEMIEADTTRKIKEDLKEFFAIRIAEIIDDIAIDAPKAFQLLALMVKGTKLDRRATLVSKSMDSDKLLALLHHLQ